MCIRDRHRLDQTWSVSVPVAYQNWLVVSATPSFDPNIGTESPGDAEHYPVTPVSYTHLDVYKRQEPDYSVMV